MDKPTCDLRGVTRDILSLQGKVISSLQDAGLLEQAQEAESRLTACDSFDDGLSVMIDYIEPKEEFITFHDEEQGKVEVVAIHRKKR